MFEKKASMRTKPSIVFGHGISADGSYFNQVIPALLAERYEGIASSSLDTNEGDVGRSRFARSVRIGNQKVRVDPNCKGELS